MDKNVLGWTFILAGAAALGVGVAIASRDKSSVGRSSRRHVKGELGRMVTRAYATTPVVAEYESPSGMKMQHRRSAEMPIEERVANIQDMIWKSVQDPEMRKLALHITHSCGDRDEMCELQSIYNAIKKRVRYTGDIGPIKQGSKGPVEPVDLFATARRVWEFKGGDCDEHACLSATLAALNGFEPILRVTADSTFGDFGHIYTAIKWPKNNSATKKVIVLDTTLPGNRFNVEVPYRRNLDFKPYTKELPAGVNGSPPKFKFKDYPA